MTAGKYEAHLLFSLTVCPLPLNSSASTSTSSLILLFIKMKVDEEGRGRGGALVVIDGLMEIFSTYVSDFMDG